MVRASPDFLEVLLPPKRFGGSTHCLLLQGRALYGVTLAGSPRGHFSSKSGVARARRAWGSRTLISLRPLFKIGKPSILLSFQPTRRTSILPRRNFSVLLPGPIRGDCSMLYVRLLVHHGFLL